MYVCIYIEHIVYTRFGHESIAIEERRSINISWHRDRLRAIETLTFLLQRVALLALLIEPRFVREKESWLGRCRTGMIAWPRFPEDLR